MSDETTYDAEDVALVDETLRAAAVPGIAVGARGGLLDHLDNLRARLARTEAWVTEYGDHVRTCPSRGRGYPACKCGFTDALREIGQRGVRAARGEV